MEANIKIFENALFGQVRSVMGESSEPWFCLADVCKALGLQSYKVAQRLEKDILSKYTLPTAGGNQEMLFVNEDGLYDVILDSRKPEAKKFRKWITSEVLPSIRKDGGYIISKEGESDEEIMARALRIANSKIKEQARRIEEQARRTTELEADLKSAKTNFRIQTMAFDLAAKEVEEQKVIISKQSEQLKQSAKAVQYHNLVLTSQSTYTATQIAKEFGWGAETLNKKLHAMGIQYKMNGQWFLYSNYCNKGYTKTITRTFTGSTGLTHTSQSTVWTELGRKFIHEKLKS